MNKNQLTEGHHVFSPFMSTVWVTSLLKPSLAALLRVATYTNINPSFLQWIGGFILSCPPHSLSLLFAGRFVCLLLWLVK